MAWRSETVQRLLPWGVLVLLLLATLVAYRGVIGNGFVVDDWDTVQRNPAVQSLTRAWTWFGSSHAASARRESQNWRPVVIASYALDRFLWGPAPAGFHAMNLVIHLGTAVLVFVLGRRLRSDHADVAALCASGVFALHPINSEAVNYVTARSSSLTALFVLAAILAYDKAVFGRRLWLVPAYSLGLAALGTKEAAATLPVLMIVWDRMRSGHREQWRMTIARSIPWWALTGGFLLWRSVVMRGAAADSMTPAVGSVVQNTAFAIKIYLASLWFWVWPSGLAVDHAWPISIKMGEGIVLVIGAVAAVVGTAAVVARYRQPGWCLVWFWTAMLPMGALPFISRTTLYQDNRGYLAGVGLAWGIGWVVAHVARRRMVSRGARLGAAVLGIGLILAAVHGDAARTAVWRDSAQLWDDVVTKYPGSVLGHNTRGALFLDAGRIDEAGQAFERSLRLAPNYSHTRYYLGLVHGRRGEWEQAVTEFQIALKINPRYTNARLALGDAYERLGRPAQALDVWETFLRDDPEVIGALRRSGMLLERQGRYEEAADRYRRLVAIDPTDDHIREAWGGVLLRLSRWADAREIFDALVARHPDSFPIRFNLGRSLDHLGLYDEAMASYHAAAELRPDQPDPYVRIAVIHAKRERWSDAALWYERALERDPGHLLSHLQLAMVAERLGERRRAVEHYRTVVSMAPQDAAYDAPRTQAREALVRLGGDRRG